MEIAEEQRHNVKEKENAISNEKEENFIRKDKEKNLISKDSDENLISNDRTEDHHHECNHTHYNIVLPSHSGIVVIGDHSSVNVRNNVSAGEEFRQFEEQSTLPSGQKSDNVYTSTSTVRENSEWFAHAPYNDEAIVACHDEVGEITGQISEPLMKKENSNKRAQKSCLPERIHGFLGRTKEVEIAISAIVEKRVAVVLISGSSGFGKSTCAIEISHTLRNKYGVFFVSIRGASTINEVCLRLCRSFGVNPGPDAQTSFLLTLDGVGDKCLLIMDNAEDILENESRRDFFDFLLSIRSKSDQRVQVLLTSTTRFDNITLNLSLEIVILRKLERNFSKEHLGSHAEEPMIDECLNNLAEQCGDNPLALRVVASLLPIFSSPVELLELLKEDTLTVLGTNFNCSVEKSVRTSFQKLNEEEQVFLVCLALFDGCFSRFAAEKVTGTSGPHALSLLRKLSGRCLLEESGQGRFSIHPLIRLLLIKFGNERCSNRWKAAAEENLVRYFLSTCEELTLLYYSKNNGPMKARDLLKVEAHNVEKSFMLCHDAVNGKASSEIISVLRDCKVYGVLCGSFCHFVLHALSRSVMLRFLEACIEVARQHEDLAVELYYSCLNAHILGRVHGWKSDEYKESMKDAKETFLRCEKQLKKESRLDSGSLMYFHYSEYMLLQSSDNFNKVKESLLHHLKLDKKNERRNLEDLDHAISLMLLARVYKRHGNAGNAVECFKEALREFENLLDDHDLTLSCHKELGDAHFDQGVYQMSVVCYENAIKIHENFEGNNFNLASVCLFKNYGLTLSLTGNVERAIEVLHEAMDLAKLFEDHKRTYYEILSGLAATYDKRQKGCHEAIKYAKLAMDLSRQVSGGNLSTEKNEKIIASSIESCSC